MKATSTPLPELSLTPLKRALRAGVDNRVDVLVRLRAPQHDAGRERAPQAIALVLDSSGSMAGAPLHEARRCAAFVVRHLRGDDRVALIAFDDKVRTMHPLLPRGDGYAIDQAIARVQTGGNTNLHGGWRAGADALAAAGSGACLKRVILLSDGCANRGQTDSGVIATECAEMAARGISTSTYGLGRNFNEDLMIAMARSGHGNQYYGDAAEDLLEPFVQEFALLDNLVATRLRLRLSAPPGVGVEVLNRFAGSGEEGWELPDLAAGAEAWALVRLTVPAAAVPAAGTLPLLEAYVEGELHDGRPLWVAAARLELVCVDAATFATQNVDEIVSRRLDELEAGAMLLEAREAARRGDWSRIDRQLSEAKARFCGNPWLAGVLEAMHRLAAQREAERFIKEASYSSSSMMRRLAALQESMGPGEFVQAVYLRRKMEQGKSTLPGEGSA